MISTDEAFAILELDALAGEGRIRRAYAGKLKCIDQHTQPAAFQQLREAYEAALSWSRTPPAPAGAALPPLPHADAADADSALRLAQATFTRFTASGAALAGDGASGDPAAWLNLLAASLDDEELVSIEAREHFEAMLATLLASGWEPGHEALLPAAEHIFGWYDPRHLRRLGEAGQLLDQAILETRLFEMQAPSVRVRMRELPRRLRQPNLPSMRYIRNAMRDVESMLWRFPALVAVFAGIQNVERWRAVYRASGAPPVMLDGDGFPITPPSWLSTVLRRHGAHIFIAIVLALGALFASSTGQPVPPSALRALEQAPPAPAAPPVRAADEARETG